MSHLKTRYLPPGNRYYDKKLERSGSELVGKDSTGKKVRHSLTQDPGFLLGPPLPAMTMEQFLQTPDPEPPLEGSEMVVIYEGEPWPVPREGGWDVDALQLEHIRVSDHWYIENAISRSGKEDRGDTINTGVFIILTVMAFIFTMVMVTIALGSRNGG